MTKTRSEWVAMLHERDAEIERLRAEVQTRTTRILGLEERLLGAISEKRGAQIVLDRTIAEREHLRTELAACAAGPWHYHPEEPTIDGQYLVDWGYCYEIVPSYRWQDGTWDNWGYPIAWSGPINDPRAPEAKRKP